ncbi:hypothetical protein CsSME_00035745 [Camellia sinensis var. sinensis]
MKLKVAQMMILMLLFILLKTKPLESRPLDGSKLTACGGGGDGSGSGGSESAFDHKEPKASLPIPSPCTLIPRGDEHCP